MSRCFEYPPPGYSPKTTSSYALIESIKLQRDKERVKSERKKERKREKKERNRKKKEKAKQESSCSRNGLISGGDNRELKTRYLQKDLENAIEQLEISSLSEEHDQPICSEDPSHSSDKRRRSTSPSNVIHGRGTTVRIRLSPQKHGECDIPTKEDCFTKSAKHKEEVSIRASADRVFPLSNTNNQLFPRIAVSKQCTSSSGWTEPIAKDKTTIASCSKLHETDLELEFKNLIMNCVPPSRLHSDFDDQDWLFQRKDKRMRVKEKGQDSNNLSCGTSALLPRAQYLDDAELYAFPFTVPF